MAHDSAKKYLEFYAKMLLESLFPEDYFDIKKGERPDLRMGNDYGIEVTWATFDNQGQANGVFSHIQGKHIRQVDKRHVKTMSSIQTKLLKKSNGIVYGYMPTGKSNKASNKELIEAYRNKKAKQFETAHTDLFIFPPLAQINGWLGEGQIEECLKMLGNDPSNPFEHIIIFEEPTLYLFDVRQKMMRDKRGAGEIITRCQAAADSYSGWSKRYKQNN